jgi:DNA-binding NarL/FixJ family response regulator
MVLDGERYIPNGALEESGAPSIFDQVTRSRAAIFESPIAKITEREIEILKLLANGQSNKQIAAKLAISPLTVKLHLRNGYKKLRANNRADAVRLAYEYGLITVPDSSG